MKPHPAHIPTRRLFMCGVAVYSLVAVYALGEPAVSFNSTVSSVRTVAGEPFYVTYTLEYPQHTGHRTINTISDYPCDREWVATAEELHYVDRQLWIEKHIRYRIVPHQPGVMVAGAADVYISRKKMRCDGHEVTVLPADPQPWNDLSLTTHHLIEREGMITVAAEASDVTVYAGQPLVYDVHVDDDVFDTEVRIDMPDFEGFWTHDVDDPPETQIERHGVSVWRRTQRTVLYPLETGVFQIPAARIAYLCRKPSYEQYGALRTRQLSIRAVEIPVEGRPEGFNGAVGEYRLSLYADNDSLATGELLAVTLRLEGTGAIDMISDVPEPDFAGFTMFSQALSDTLRAEVIPAGGVREWQYTLRADIAGGHSIGPVSFDYFNPWRRRYECTRTQAIAVHVDDTAVSMADIELKTDTVMKDIGSHRSLHYIKPDKSELLSIDPLWRDSGYWSLYLLPSTAWFVFLSYRKTTAFREYVRGWIRYKRAMAELVRVLARAEQLCAAGDTDTCRRVIYDALGDVIHCCGDRRSADGKDAIFTVLYATYRDAERYRYSPESPDREWCMGAIARIRLLLKK